MRKRLFTLLLMLCPLLIAGMASAKDITIYVQADKSPKLWFWGDATNSTDWPGEALTQTTQVQNPTTGATQTFYYKTFTGLAENASISMLISYDGDADKTSDINGITSDRYFWYKGDKQYEDITEQFTAIPDATIEYVGISGSFNGWPGPADAPKFTVATANQEYTYDLDLTSVSGDVIFKIQPNGTWLGYPQITPAGETSWLSDDGGSDHNIKLAHSTSGYKTYKLTATWAGGADPSAGWTLKVEGDEPRTEPIVNTYTVAGEPAEIIGAYWNQAYEANDMTAVGDGTYTLTKENVTIAAGTEIQFKIVKNHSWGSDNEYGNGGLGGGNISYIVTDAGLYNVTFTFNPEETSTTPQITVTPATYDFTQHAYRVCGEGFAGGWGASEGDATMNPMTLTDGKYVFTKSGYEVTDAHSESYRIRVDDAYLTNVSPFTIDGIQNNKTVTFDAAGTYDVTVTFDPVALTVSAVATAAVTPDPDTYTIVGVEDVINGDLSWDPTATANDMTENAGVWTLTVEGANLEAGQKYLYKMVKNHAWGDGEVPAQGNQTLTVEETAEYTLTYTFDGTTLSCNATKTGGDEPVDGQELVNGDHKVVIKGVHYLNLAENNYVLTIKSEETMTGLGGSFWHTSAGNKDLRENMTVAEDGKTITITTTTTTDPQLYTPLYVLIKDAGEVNFTGEGEGNAPIIEWQEEGEVTYQVTFVNEAGWEGNIYAYAWSGDDKVLGDWPGTQMENEGNNTFSITLPSAAEYIIFTNNNGSQTADLAFVNNKQYTNAEEPADSYTVKFVNIAGWNDVYVYGWNGSTNSGWTANKAEKTSTVNVFGVDADVYECTISLSVEPKNLIFHNNDGTQTQDLQWVEGATYSYDDTEKGYFLFTDDADQFKPAQTFDVAGAKASYARKFTPGNVCTVVLPFAIGADVAKDAGKFYRINSIADGYIRGTEETPAPYVPYIFVPATEYPFTNIGIGQLPEVQNNSITTAEGYTLQFVTETTELASDASYDYYGFQGGKFVKAAYATVNPFRSYIQVAKSANAPATLIWTDDEATGISSLKADIQNGKANVYDLQGRRVLNPVRGLYIVNGKKVIVK